jgi:hypothetical protein
MWFKKENRKKIRRSLVAPSMQSISSRTFWGNNKDNYEPNNSRNNSSSFKIKSQRVRSFYNGRNVTKFMRDVPY